MHEKLLLLYNNIYNNILYNMKYIVTYYDYPFLDLLASTKFITVSLRESKVGFFKIM